MRRWREHHGFLVLLLMEMVSLLALLVGCGVDGKKPGKLLEVGTPAPGFTLPASDAGAVSLADYRGRSNVLLYFNMAYG